MSQKTLDGQLFKKIMLGGAKNLSINVEIVNDLNVFPIPDGDTGSNMNSTLTGGVRTLVKNDEQSLGKVATEFAHGALLGARGNSGVILSQFFSGIAKSLAECDSANVQVLGVAFTTGVEFAYKSVAKPVEGTILTVIKSATEYATKNVNEESSLLSFFSDFALEMKCALDRTPEQLSVLKEAGVVDSGGAGMLYIAEGILKIINGESIEWEVHTFDTEKEVDFSKFNENSVMVYGYCTELLLQLQVSKTDVDTFSVDELIKFLDTIGDSIVAVKTGSVVKIHVHTLTPYKVLEHCQKYGEYLSVKIENMTLQHNEVEDAVQEKPQFKKRFERSRYGVIAVAEGTGMINVYKELGAHIIINGGQGKNPSTQTFIDAFDAVNADTIFVLPNNSNVYMTALQSVDLFSSSKVLVLDTKNMGDGYSALSALDYSIGDDEEIFTAMTDSVKSATSGLISRAVRTAYINNVDIKENDYVGFVNKKMLVSSISKTESTKQLISKLVNDNYEFIIVFYGKTVTKEEKLDIKEYVTSTYADKEFYEIDGNQDVYDLMIVLQ